MKTGSILIVDDDEPIRKLLNALLRGQHTCVLAESVEAALPQLNSTCFDLIITDIHLPGRSGLDLCRIVKDISPRTRVLMISGRSDPETVRQSLENGAFHFLPKPFDITDLTDAIDRALGCQVRCESG